MVSANGVAGTLRTQVSNGDYSLWADAPVAKGGGGSGFGAHQLLEASFASCICMAVRMRAAADAIPLSSVEVDVSLTLPEDGGPAQLGYSLTLTGPLCGSQRKTLEDAARQCPVRTTLSRGFIFAEKPEPTEAFE